MTRRVPGGLWVLASYVLLAAVYTWPAARLDASVLPTRHFDLYSTIWLLDRAPYIDASLHHAASGWPFGETLLRADSYVLLVLGWLNRGVLPGATLAQLLLWLGPAVSAWAAEACAHHAFAIRRPFSWIAGLAYGFSGIAAVALLEGHAYFLLNPWLPLLAWALWRGSGPHGRWWHGLGAGLSAALCLYTSAYVGVCAVLLGAALLLPRPRGSLRLLPGLTLTAVPAGLHYAWLFSLGGGWRDNAPVDPSSALQTGTATLATLLAVDPAIDLGGHSLAAPLAWVPFGLWAVAPWVLWPHRGWRALWVLAGLCLLASFGATLRITAGEPGLSGPLGWLALHLPGLSYLRFPLRLLWVFHFAVGVIAAQVLAARGRWAVPLLALAVVDVFVTARMPSRLPAAIGTVPSAYAAAPPDRAVLDLYGETIDASSGEMEMWARALGCSYQGQHGRPILERCIGTAVQSPREIASRCLLNRTAGGPPDPEEARAVLDELGVGAVALHLDTLRPADALWLRELLGGAAAAETSDGGERIALYVLPEAAYDATRAQRRLRDCQVGGAPR